MLDTRGWHAIVYDHVVLTLSMSGNYDRDVTDVSH